MAGISTLEQANTFLRECYIAEFNWKFTKSAAEKGTAFRKCGRQDLEWVFSIQTERTVARDNTVVLQNRYLQLDKTRFRNTLAGCTVTICEHLNGSVSCAGVRICSQPSERKETVEKTAPLALEISPKPRDSHFAHRPTTTMRKLKSKASTKAA